MLETANRGPERQEPDRRTNRGKRPIVLEDLARTSRTSAADIYGQWGSVDADERSWIEVVMMEMPNEMYYYVM